MKKTLLFFSALIAVLAVNAQQRVPLLEVFTSSTCGPCNPGNAVFESVLAGKPTSDYVSIKFQQNFPSTGDPYCTTESYNRRTSYYAINSIPRMEIDGGWNLNAQSFTDAIYNQYRAVAAKYTLTGTYTIKNKIVTAKVKYSPLVAGLPAGTKLYVAITESQTIKNIKTNGETKFYNVMKKMLPTETGTTIATLTVGQKDSTTLTFTFNGAYRLPPDGQTANRIDNATEYSVEDFNNLKVVAWVQGTNKEVYQAGNLSKVNPTDVPNVSNTVGEVTVFPNPANNLVNIDLSMVASDNVSATLYSMSGAAVDTKFTTLGTGKGSLTFDTQNLAAGIYNLVVRDSKNNSFTQRVTVAH